MFKNLINFLDSLNLPSVYLLIVGFSLLFLYNVLLRNGEQQFVYLANSFLHGKLYFLQMPGTWNDAAFYNNHYYWSSAPFPAIILIPFAFLLGLNIQQGYIQFLLNIVNFILLFLIAKKITKSPNTSFWLAFGFTFSTAFLYIALIPWSWFFAQILTTTLLLFAIYEYFTKKRIYLIGICIALAFITRASSVFSIFFFAGHVIYSNIGLNKKINNLLLLFLPLLIAFGIFVTYNYLRFNNFFERGDSYASFLYREILDANRQYGLWSVTHMPGNLYYLFFKGPEAVFVHGTKILTFPYLYPDPWGMSILFTSPLFLWIFQSRFKNINVKLALWTSLLILVFNIGWFSIGMRQFGYRYAIDFYPFLFIILCFGFKKPISWFLKAVIVTSFFFNLYLIPLALIAKI